MKKKLISLLLAVIMVFGLTSTVFAAGADARLAANELHTLGLFGGTGTDANGKPIFELDRAPTRQEAITILVGLLGKTEEAKAGKWNMPFTDVDNWAKPFVGYAYANGIASGSYDWAWSFDEATQTFTFAGTGSDTVKLASNASEDATYGGFHPRLRRD